MKKIFTIVCLAMFVLALAAPVFADPVLRIGVYQPLTGANAAGGILELRGIQLAHELFPTVDIGGVTHRVELFVADNRSDRVEAPLVVERLIDQDRVHLILGTWGSSMAIPGGAVGMAREMPMIALSATNPLVTRDNPWYFRVCFIDPFQGVVMANYAYTHLNARTAVLVQEITNDYSVGLARFFSEHFTRLGGSVLATVNYNTGDTDFTAQLTSVRTHNPDVIFAPGNFTESALVMRQARDLGITQPFLGGDTWETDQFLTVGGDRVEGATFSTKFAVEFAETPEAQQFVSEFKKRWPDEQIASVTALGYDGYLVALDAVKRAGSLNNHSIREALTTTNVPGATATTTFDEHGDAVKAAFIKDVHNGQFRFLTLVEP